MCVSLIQGVCHNCTFIGSFEHFESLSPLFLVFNCTINRRLISIFYLKNNTAHIVKYFVLSRNDDLFKREYKEVSVAPVDMWENNIS